MSFQHSGDLWRDFPHLVPAVVYVQGITPGADSGPAADRFAAVAKSRLAAVSAEGELPEIQAWRRAFATMGLKPTQYRCAAESLLRRFRREGGLPRLHPLVDLCNAISLAYAIPVAVFDVDSITGPLLEVRYATGQEIYLTFAGDIEHPAPGEVIFADQAARARPPLDEPAERPVRGPGLHRHRPDRGRSAPRPGAPRHPRTHRGPGRGTPVPLARHPRNPDPDRRLAPLLLPISPVCGAWAQPHQMLRSFVGRMGFAPSAV